MRFSRLTLTNIRSFQSVDIALSPKVTLVVGENNSGKSTLLQCILSVQQSIVGAESIRYGAPTGKIRVHMTAFEAPEFHSSVRGVVSATANADSSVAMEATIQRDPGTTTFTLLLPNDTTSRWENFTNEQPHNVLVPYFSNRRTTSMGENVGASYAYGVNTGHQYLYAKIDACVSSRELREPFSAACQEVLGFEVTTWSSPNGKMAGLEVSARRRQHIPLTQMGAGVSHVVGLIVELLMTSNKTYLVEELENDLHPGALRTLLQLIERSVANGNQFVISTHSNVVVRHIGGLSDTLIYEVERIRGSMPPESRLRLVANEPPARRKLLNSLGYDLMDYDLFTAWLILEESSSEAIIREFLIPWFAPKLVGRIRTIAGNGADDVEPRFIDLHRLMTFVHLEPIYHQRAWAWCDGDEAGRAAVNKLRDSFKSWPEHHFVALDSGDFETYYPSAFAAETTQALAIVDVQQKRTAKAALCNRVKAWLRADVPRGSAALTESAAFLIAKLKLIESVVSSSES
jgi:ABC-type transport system involved in cytochrome c biogenesis ATPase subunit